MGLTPSSANETQGEILGVYYSIQGLAMGLSPLFVGSLIGAYPGLTGWGGAIMMGMTCLVCFRELKKSRSNTLNRERDKRLLEKC